MTTLVSDHARTTLVALLKAAYPHRSLPDGPYERTADAVIASAEDSTWNLITLEQGLASLDAAAGGDFAALDPGAAEKLLHGIADAPYFAHIRSIAVVALYDDHETWGALGYEGASFDQGGYLHRGFDDLDWLPAARVTEYDGPDQLVEVAPADEPNGAQS